MTAPTARSPATPAVLTAGLRALHGDTASLADWTAQAITKRGKRRVVQYEVFARVAGASGLRHYRWVGKVYDTPEEGSRVATTLRALAGARTGARDGLILPRVITYDAPRRTLVLTHESGTSVVAAIARHPGPVLRALGRALAGLHATPVTPGARTSPGDVLRDARRRVSDLCARCPGHAAALMRLVADLEGRAPTRGPATSAFLHGDLGPVHLLWRMGSIAALDFDRCTNGDPALDLGHLLTQLHRLAVRRPGKLPPIASLRRGLLAGYQAWAPADGDLVRRVAWYEQVVLLQKIHFLLSDTTRHPDALAMRERRDEAITLMGGASG